MPTASPAAGVHTAFPKPENSRHLTISFILLRGGKIELFCRGPSFPPPPVLAVSFSALPKALGIVSLSAVALELEKAVSLKMHWEDTAGLRNAGSPRVKGRRGEDQWVVAGEAVLWPEAELGDVVLAPAAGKGSGRQSVDTATCRMSKQTLRMGC